MGVDQSRRYHVSTNDRRLGGKRVVPAALADTGDASAQTVDKHLAGLRWAIGVGLLIRFAA